VSRVRDFRFTFFEALSFNQPLGDWKLQQVELIFGMFYNTESFSQNLCSWGPYYLKVLQTSLFYNTRCPHNGPPASSAGPWCHHCGNMATDDYANILQVKSQVEGVETELEEVSIEAEEYSAIILGEAGGEGDTDKNVEGETIEEEE